MLSNQGLYLPSDAATSTHGYEYHQFSSQIKSEAEENKTSAGLPQEQYHYLLSQHDLLQNKVQELESDIKQSKKFFRQATLLQQVCLGVIILLPVIVATAAAVTVWLLSTDPVLVNCAMWYLRILGLSGVADLIYIFVSHKNRESRIEQIERRLDQSEK